MATSECGNPVRHWWWNRRERDGESATVVPGYNENRPDFLSMRLLKTAKFEEKMRWARICCIRALKSDRIVPDRAVRTNELRCEGIPSE